MHREEVLSAGICGCSAMPLEPRSCDSHVVQQHLTEADGHWLHTLAASDCSALLCCAQHVDSQVQACFDVQLLGTTCCGKLCFATAGLHLLTSPEAAQQKQHHYHHSHLKIIVSVTAWNTRHHHRVITILHTTQHNPQSSSCAGRQVRRKAPPQLQLLRTFQRSQRMRWTGASSGCLMRGTA